jgi:hypothetical protein
VLGKIAAENNSFLTPALEAENASDESEIALRPVGSRLGNTTLRNLDWQDVMHRWTDHQKPQEIHGGSRFGFQDVCAVEERSCCCDCGCFVLSLVVMRNLGPEGL